MNSLILGGSLRCIVSVYIERFSSLDHFTPKRGHCKHMRVMQCNFQPAGETKGLKTYQNVSDVLILTVSHSAIGAVWEEIHYCHGKVPFQEFTDKCEYTTKVKLLLFKRCCACSFWGLSCQFILMGMYFTVEGWAVSWVINGWGGLLPSSPLLSLPASSHQLKGRSVLTDVLQTQPGWIDLMWRCDYRLSPANMGSSDQTKWRGAHCLSPAAWARNATLGREYELQRVE